MSTLPGLSLENRHASEPPLPVSEAARPVMNRIVLNLRQLMKQLPSSPREAAFLQKFREICMLIDEYQQILTTHAEQPVSCTCGCDNCCNHWVEDVNSFEAVIIAEYIRIHFPERIDELIRRCRDDCSELERLQELVDERVSLMGNRGKTTVENEDLLLGVFYQMRRPCPLLTKDGSCSIYPVRPITCRIYVSFSDPIRCNPDYINTSVVPTAILDLSETANELLDALHFNYMRFEGDTGLRSLLLKYLSGEDVT